MIDFKKKMKELEKKEAKENGHNEILLVDEFQPKKRKISNYLIAIIVIALIFSGRVIMSSQSTTDWLVEKGFLNKLKHLVISGDKQIKGEDDDRINILLLGMGGEGHEGPYLADTIILASLKPSTGQVALISLPRDLNVPVTGAGWRKINHINALAEAAEKGTGGEASISTLSEILQIPIDYYITADFEGFINIIDEIGGIEVNVENTVNDYTYPIFGEEDNPDYYARFEHLYIEAGEQKMNGSLALKYARSRHSLGIEGSDFARAKRQQLVIEAVKNKLLSKETLLNPVTIGKLINEFNRHVSTNLEVWEIIRLWDMFKDVSREKIINKVLSDAPGGLLVSTINSEGAYTLMPITGNFAQIRSFVQTIFNNGEEVITEIEKLNTTATISVQNGTWITGLAGKTTTELEAVGLMVSDTSNAPDRDVTKTLVFDLTYGNKNEVLEFIKKTYNAEQSFVFPDWVKTYQAQENAADFILLLGTNANNAY